MNMNGKNKVMNVQCNKKPAGFNLRANFKLTEN